MCVVNHSPTRISFESTAAMTVIDRDNDALRSVPPVTAVSSLSVMRVERKKLESRVKEKHLIGSMHATSFIPLLSGKNVRGIARDRGVLSPSCIALANAADIWQKPGPTGNVIVT